MTSAPESSASMRSIHTWYDYRCFVARHANTVVAPAKRPSVTRVSQGRLTELGLLILAWVIVSSFYVLASLGAKGHLPDRLGVFLTSIIAISLAMHVCIRYLAPNASQVLLPIATLLNGIGYIEIARWNPRYAGYQALWFLISAVALVVTLVLVRRVRDLDRYRYLTLLAAIGLLLMPLLPHIGKDYYGARLWVSVGSISFQPVEIAKILLVFFFASYFAANRELLSTPTQRIGRRQIVPPKVLLPILFARGVGGRRVSVGSISFQPVEIAKILLVFFFASYFAANRELLSTPTQRIGRRQIVPPK